MIAISSAVQAMSHSFSRAYGAASLRALQAECARLRAEGVGWVEAARVAEAELVAVHGLPRLDGELRDDRARDRAIASDDAFLSYVTSWERRLAGLQRRDAGRWHVRGLADDEVRDALMLSLFEALRSEPLPCGRPGTEWGLWILMQARDALRSRFRLRVTHGSEHDVSATRDRALNEEDAMLAEEHTAAMHLARERAEASLSRPQRRWYAAMRMAANAGAFFERSGKLNLAAASRVLDRDRSSAQRAFGELQRTFARELDRLS